MSSEYCPITNQPCPRDFKCGEHLQRPGKGFKRAILMPICDIAEKQAPLEIESRTNLVFASIANNNPSSIIIFVKDTKNRPNKPFALIQKGEYQPLVKKKSVINSLLQRPKG